ncbi:MAG: plasmid stabilization protein [Rhodocyclales bacterium]|nr:plasmid stabilization protein [Rhodocyclales bacterium]
MVRFAALARDDLLEIARYIARDNPARARSFVVELRDQCDLLAKHPGIGVARSEYGEGLRMLPHGRYLNFFSIIAQDVLIERVLHSARDVNALFTPGEDSSG